ANMNRSLSVEEIQDMVEDQIMNQRAFDVARRYITYRYTRALVRKSNTTDEQILSLIECNNEEVKQENSNKNPTVNSVQRDYMAGEVSKDITKRILLEPDIVDAHERGLIHFHDADYFAQHMHNCDLVNLEDMLQNGTVISGTYIEKPHTFSTACNIATQIIAQVASCQYGGQSISLAHLAPFVDISRKKLYFDVKAELDGIEDINDDMIKEIAEKRLRDEIRKGVQTIQYQVVTLMTTNGQAPFVTVFMYLNEAKNEQEKKDLAMIIEEVLKQRYQGVKNEKGVWITPAFPKLIYVLEEDNIKEGTEYWYLTQLAAKCTAKRMVPDYISEKIMLQNKIDKNGEGHCYTCMGCRSFLTPFVDENGKPKYYGRFNQGVVTVNLVDIGLSAGGNEEKFWQIFDERMELCHRALQARHERLTGTLSDAAPILWQYGALLRLKKGETIDKYLHGGYSTLSLGYAGLWECVYAMNGKKLTEPEGEEFGLKVMKKLNEYTAKWKAAENIDYSLYGTPLESTTYKFAKCLQKRFGTIKGVTDRNYITNSYHVHVGEEIDAFDKLALEAKFQLLSPGGAISYVEVPNMQNNIDAVLSVMQFIYDNIMYAELNTKSDYCHNCGFDGEIGIEEDEHGKLVWTCPNCGNTDQDRMNVARRTCGYIGTQYWNQGRTQEIKERVLHL
ncbi:MAG: anaerobic ribonucleoside-triphosphate reductase, partial [Ruminococcaceae bacterium]|nr:anaerobic ribonucleoside-triphosphate reductase [Oscillospiraceae bacterium]